MARVLHILDQHDPPAGLGPTLALIADTQAKEPGDHLTLLLGGQPIRDAAKAAGLRPDHTRLIPSPRGLARLALAVRKQPRNLLSQADRVDCWSVRAATFAAEVGCSTFNPRFGQVGNTPFAQQTLDPARLALRPEARQAVRDRWALTDTDHVIALLTDHPESLSAITPTLITALTLEALRPIPPHAPHADAESAKRLVPPQKTHTDANQASASEASGSTAPHPAPRLHLLIPPPLRHLADAQALYANVNLPRLILQDPSHLYPWQTLPAADAALLLDPADAPLSLIFARQAKLPIIQGPAKPKHLAQQLHTHFSPTT